MFSKACEYAIRAVIYILTETSNGSRVGIKDISRNTATPEPFIGKVLQVLSRQGIVGSVKGPNGGFFLHPQAASIPVIDIVKAIDGDDLFVSCGLGIARCSDKKPCPIHHEYKQIRDRVVAMLTDNTIQQLATGFVNGETFLTKR